MLLGLRAKHRKGIVVQVDYLVHAMEIKPWPPSQSLRSVQSVLLQWENGEHNFGSIAASVGDGKIEFSESFRLQVTLCGEASRKNTARDSFQKNFLEFYFYEPRKEKAAKGQLLGSAVINLADFGLIKETITVSSPINLKRSSRNSVQPVLYVNIQPFDRDSSSSSPMVSLSKEVSLDKDGSESVSELMSDRNDEEIDIASFTDDGDADDASSHSSRAVQSSVLEAARGSPGKDDKNESGSVSNGTERINGKRSPPLGLAPAKPDVNEVAEIFKHVKGSSPPLSSLDLSSNLGAPGKDLEAKLASSDAYIQASVNSNHGSFEESQANLEEDRNNLSFVHEKSHPEEAATSNFHFVKKEKGENGQGTQSWVMKKHPLEDKLIHKLPYDASTKQLNSRSNTLASSRTAPGVQVGTVRSHKLKHLKSVQLHFDHVAKSNGLLGSTQFMEKPKEVNTLEHEDQGDRSYLPRGREETSNGFCGKKAELESKVEMLKEELRETAALEVGLYSVVAEHGSSISKVHAPARRLSRFYFHACKASSLAKRASAARAVVSGLVLVSKACGNDVPRLTFWLSNSILLRAIVSQTVGKLQLSAAPSINKSSAENKQREIAPHGQKRHDKIDSYDDWEEPQTFIITLEKVEAWIFSRIVESVWWQTLTPHMQSTAVKGSRKTNNGRYRLGDQEQGNFAVDLWKKAFKDACERLCPIRAGGHECGCLPVLARLVMEQLVGRLDVAMFNAILRESAEEMPTDPVSDPISDPKVLPIPAGKSSFGAGAQLKNAVGNWSRWLTDLFGIDENDSMGGKDQLERETSFKAFHLLNALSDLMMLPFEMLADRSTRKEVCPIFGVSLIKRVLYNFVPDEFNPDPIPEAVLEALDSEDLPEAVEDTMTGFPCNATPTVYSPPPAASLTNIIGDVGSQTLQRSASTVLRKAYTSDDELDELDSPITSIIIDNSRASPTSTAPNWMPKGNGGRKVVRYQLLREAWRDSE